MSRVSLIIRYVILIGVLVLQIFAYKKENCEFRTANYSLEWAYEPETRNVVFILKTLYIAKENSSKEYDGFWTGVGFDAQKSEKPDEIDFIGIFTKSWQIGLLDGHMNSKGVLFPDKEDNVHTIALKTARSDGSVVAKFARSLWTNGTGDSDLSGCTTFYFPIEGVSTLKKEERTENNTLITFEFGTLKTMNVCGIANECRIDLPNKLDHKAGLEENIARRSPESSHQHDASNSIDIQNDLCSFSSLHHYNITWNFDPSTNSVNFIMIQEIKNGKWWSAVGIGESMSDMDIGILFLEDGFIQKIGDYYSEKYSMPVKDVHQDWLLDRETSHRIGNFMELHFSRAINTPDLEKDRSMDGCIVFQFASNLGTYDQNFQIHKHNNIPDLYKTCNIRNDCIKNGVGKIAASIDGTTNITEPKFEVHDNKKGFNFTISDKNEGVHPNADIKFEDNDKNTSPKLISSTASTASFTENVSPTISTTFNDVHHTVPNSNILSERKIDDSEANNSSNSLKSNVSLIPVTQSTILRTTQNGVLIPFPLKRTEKLIDMNDTHSAPSTKNETLNIEKGVNSNNTSNMGETNIFSTTEVNPMQNTAVEISSSTNAAALTDSNGTTTSASSNQPPSSTILNTEEASTTLKANELMLNTSVNGIATTHQPSLSISSENGTKPKEIMLPLSGGCDALKPDLNVCKSYMDNYLNRVRDWANNHNEPMENQYGKLNANETDLRNF